MWQIQRPHGDRRKSHRRDPDTPPQEFIPFAGAAHTHDHGPCLEGLRLQLELGE